MTHRSAADLPVHPPGVCSSDAATVRRIATSHATRADGVARPNEHAAPRHGAPRSSSFLPGLHAFRALAVWLVVGQHAAWILPWPPNSQAREILADVVDNSTVLFVFLSGFLFAHLRGRYSYLGFLRRRLTTVVIPYVFVVTPAAVVAVLSPDLSEPFTDIAGWPAVLRYAWFVVHGATLVNAALWFVPMITIYYLISPVFTMFARKPQLYWLLVLLVPFSMLAHRSAFIPHADILQPAVYYASAYILGMAASQFRSRIEPYARYWWVFSLAFLAALVAEILFSPHHGNYEGLRLFSTEHGLVDWLFGQKLLLCAALLAVTHRFAHRLADLRLLRYLGFASFSVYLLHCFLLDAIKLAIEPLHITGSVPAWAAATVLAVGGSLVIVVIARKVLGPYSLYVIGSVDERISSRRAV